MGTLESFLQSHFTPSYSRPQNPVYGDGFQPGGLRGGEQFIPSARSGLDPIRDVDFVPRTVNGLQSTFEFNQPLTNISLFNVVGAPAAGSGPPGPPGPQGPAGLPGEGGSGGGETLVETAADDSVTISGFYDADPNTPLSDRVFVTQVIGGIPVPVEVMIGPPEVDSSLNQVRFPKGVLLLGLAAVKDEDSNVTLRVALEVVPSGNWTASAVVCT